MPVLSPILTATQILGFSPTRMETVPARNSLSPLVDNGEIRQALIRIKPDRRRLPASKRLSPISENSHIEVRHTNRKVKPSKKLAESQSIYSQRLSEWVEERDTQ